MKTPVTCLGCHRQYEVDDRFAGKTIKCSYCEKPMLIPAVSAAAPPLLPVHGEYALDDAHEPAPSTYRASHATSGEQRSQAKVRRSDRPKKKARNRSKRRDSEPSESALSLPAVLVGLAAIAVVLALVGYFVPGARRTAGLALALPGLLLCIYGYASGAYIAFTEDDLYGWLYVLFPFYAAYYVVSRWDEMRSRLIIVAVGLTLLAIGGRLLEANREQDRSKTPEAAAGL